MTIVPILKRELIVASRRAGLHSGRSTFVGLLLAIVMGVFGAWYYLEAGHFSRSTLATIAAQSYGLIFGIQAIMMFLAVSVGAVSIAAEKDRRTLDFLLATRLSSAEIVLGKLAACLVGVFAGIVPGLPLALLLNVLGGIDLRLILLTYAAMASSVFFVLAASIWISTGAPDARRAAGVAVLTIMAWLILPIMVSLLVPRLGLPIPRFIFTVNAWVLNSGPMGLLLKFAGGGPPGALVRAVTEMASLQVAAGVVLLIGSIVRLRAAYRVNLGGDGHGWGARPSRPYWRFRPRPPVSDDPILWREIHTSRVGLVGKLVGLVFSLGIYAGLAYPTFFFARRAFVEVWHHGYSSGLTTSERPELNVMTRFFFTDPGAAVDLARTDFNVFLRAATVPLVFIITLSIAGIAAETIATERARQTWNSLIATSLTARDILTSKLRACVWRLRALLLTVVVLWTIGLAAGAVHPLGYLLTILELAGWTWLLLTFGLLVSVRWQDPATAGGGTVSLLVFPLISGVLPFALPAKLSSVLWGAGSSLFVTWLSLLSYRDVRAALHYSVYPQIAWASIATGEGPLSVAATCLIGILAPAGAGWWIWRYSLANFDRLIGRPWQAKPRPQQQVTTARVAVA